MPITSRKVDAAFHCILSNNYSCSDDVKKCCWETVTVMT